MGVAAVQIEEGLLFFKGFITERDYTNSGRKYNERKETTVLLYFKRQYQIFGDSASGERPLYLFLSGLY